MISARVVLLCSCVGNKCTVCPVVWQNKNNHFNTDDTVMTVVKIMCQIKQSQRAAWDHKISCGATHWSVACFSNFCVTEEKAKHLPHILPRWLHPFYDKNDVTNYVFPNPESKIKITHLALIHFYGFFSSSAKVIKAIYVVLNNNIWQQPYFSIMPV